MLRSGGVEIVAAALRQRRPGARRPRGRARAGQRVIAPSAAARRDRRRARAAPGCRADRSPPGVCCRRFMLGKRSVPPATTCALGLGRRAAAPPRATATARSTGSAAAASWATPLAGAPTRARRAATGAPAPGRARGRSLSALPSPPCPAAAPATARATRIGREIAAVQSAAPCPCSAFKIFSGVTGTSSTRTPTASIDGVGHRRHDRQERPWPTSLAPNGPLRVGLLDQVGDDLGHVERARALVLEHRRELVHVAREASAAGGGRPAPPSTPRRGPCRPTPSTWP